MPLLYMSLSYLKEIFGWNQEGVWDAPSWQRRALVLCSVQNVALLSAGQLDVNRLSLKMDPAHHGTGTWRLCQVLMHCTGYFDLVNKVTHHAMVHHVSLAQRTVFCLCIHTHTLKVKWKCCENGLSHKVSFPSWNFSYHKSKNSLLSWWFGISFLLAQNRRLWQTKNKQTTYPQILASCLVKDLAQGFS